jgi:acyl phosphate:glycerol-3-phosphate acyltransferase
MILLLPALLAGYAIGSIPFAVVMARLSGGFDVTREGTRNPGATNVFKHVGRVAGAAVGLLDYFKALVPALLAHQWLGLGTSVAMAVGVGVVLGHDFSAWLRLRGGKGGASTLGVFSYIDFPALIATGVLWAVALPFLRGRRFVAGPVALTLFPILTALHAVPPLRSFLDGWGRHAGAAPVLVAIALLILLWVRVLPGLETKEPR